MVRTCYPTHLTGAGSDAHTYATHDLEGVVLWLHVIAGKAANSVHLGGVMNEDWIPATISERIAYKLYSSMLLTLVYPGRFLTKQ